MHVSLAAQTLFFFFFFFFFFFKKKKKKKIAKNSRGTILTPRPRGRDYSYKPIIVRVTSGSR